MSKAIVRHSLGLKASKYIIQTMSHWSCHEAPTIISSACKRIWDESYVI